MRRLALPLALLTSFLGLACDDADADTSAESTESGGPVTHTHNGIITDFVASAAVVDMEVCLRDQTTIACETTDAEGGFAIQVPDATDYILTFNKATFMEQLLHGNTQVPVVDISHQVATQDTMALVVQQGGETLDIAKGQVAVTGPEGAVVTVSPASGVLIYFGTDGIPDPALTAMTARGLVGIANVDPGTIELSVALTGQTCTSAGWPGSDIGRTRVLVEANKLSVPLGFVCQ